MTHLRRESGSAMASAVGSPRPGRPISVAGAVILSWVVLGTVGCVESMFGDDDDFSGDVCGDGSCGGSEGCEDCPEDCGECLTTCGDAGGDTCAGASSSLCDGLPLLPSSDCELCCDRSVYPPITPSSHHIVVIDDVYSWDAILDLAAAGQGPMIASQNPPPQVDHDQWTQNIHTGWYASGAEMADAIHAGLCDPDSGPAKVMIDELRTDTVDMIEECADRMRTVYPQWVGRWGAYVVNGENVAYPNLNPAIDALLQANALIGVEMYPYRSAYCAAGEDAGERDVWLGDFFRGGPSIGRFHWLVERRTHLGSASWITVLFGVTDNYMDGDDPAIFLDRMFYVWVTRTGYRQFLLSPGGGAGAYKWDAAAVSNTSRDLAFKESFQHYCIDGEISSRLGQVSCP